jgi:hypothetical protein
MTFLKTLTKPKKRTIITKAPAPNTGVGKDVYARAIAASLPNTGGGKDAYARAVAALKKGQVKKGPIKRPAPQRVGKSQWAMTESMVKNLRKLNISS